MEDSTWSPPSWVAPGYWELFWGSLLSENITCALGFRAGEAGFWGVFHKAWPGLCGTRGSGILFCSGSRLPRRLGGSASLKIPSFGVGDLGQEEGDTGRAEVHGLEFGFFSNSFCLSKAVRICKLQNTNLADDVSRDCPKDINLFPTLSQNKRFWTSSGVICGKCRKSHLINFFNFPLENFTFALAKIEII